MNFPINLILFIAFVISVCSIIGVFILNNKQDKIFMLIGLISQLIIILVFVDILKHLDNLFKIVSLVTLINFTIFLFAKKDRDKPYFYHIIHITSIIQTLYVWGIIIR